ncbi:Oidioi.mRNA.OKI2018_I69.chr1.g73.t1.cds [Oikopleura dioica]|uniref:Carbonic anhydrase n=1 Tax=Oikopleura dioica TaxID=34765 RepID=A0ABN7SQZ0_OIKDI|nr:Oidioi.mRNA.OKI2018_I69.chr1.g73.t1.cds [Oikopleura dioica]
MRLSTAILASIPLCSSDRIPRSAGSWGYAEQGNEWGDSVAACNGVRQSPIDIPKKVSTAEFQPFELTNFDEEQKWTLVNNGHAVQMTASEPLNMKTNGGALPGEYTLAQFHFHWGSSDHGGSEHTLEGEQFFSEVHLVHFKSEYGTIGDSVDKSDGLAVLGFFIEEDVTAEDTPLDNFFLNMVGQAVQDPKKTSEIQFSMSEILPSTLDNFYRYLGSLTTPTCNEAVVWTNFKEPLKISTKTKEFMTQFAKVYKYQNISTHQ